MTATAEGGGNREADSQNDNPVQRTGGCVALPVLNSNCLRSKKVVRFCGRVHGGLLDT